MSAIETFRLWATVVLLALSFFWTVYWTLRQSKRAAAKDEQDKLATELAALRTEIRKDEGRDTEQFATVNARLTKVEDNIAHLPTKDQIHGIELSMGEMKGDMRELKAGLQPLTRTMDRVLNFMDQTRTS